MYTNKSDFWAVAYSDVFDFPLTRREVFLRGIEGAAARKKGQKNIVVAHGGLVSLAGREAIGAIRRHRFLVSQERYERAWRLASWIGRIPTVACIGATGSLAVFNAQLEDDTDICVITSPRSLWFTRACILVLTTLMGIRRTPGDTQVAGKFCFNMFLDTDHLQLPSNEQDLYAAYELMQFRPLFWRGNVYTRFLDENAWAKAFVPELYRVQYSFAVVQDRFELGVVGQLIVLWARFIEGITKAVQQWYMRRRMTRERIDSGFVRFHPRDARRFIAAELAKRCQAYHVPLDNNFFAALK